MEQYNMDSNIDPINITNNFDKLNSQLNDLLIFTDYCTSLLKCTEIEVVVKTITEHMCKIIHCTEVTFIRKDIQKNWYISYKITPEKVFTKRLHKDNLGTTGIFLFCKKIRISSEDDNFIAVPIKQKGENLAAIVFHDISFSSLKNSYRNLLELYSLPAGIMLKTCLLMEELKHEKNIIELTNERISMDLKYAKRVQDSIIPSGYRKIQNYKFYGNHTSSYYIGGDFYNVLEAKNGDIVFYLGDVAGHGAAAALITVFIQQTINSIVDTSVSKNEKLLPSKILFELQENFIKFKDNNDIYIGLIMGVISKEKLYLCNAGHNIMPLHYIDEINEIIQYDLFGLPINNWLPIHENNYSDIEIDINDNDKIFLLTDGATEAQNENSEQFGEDRLKDILINKNLSSNKVYLEILEQIYKFKNSTKLEDDIAFLTISKGR